MERLIVSILLAQFSCIALCQHKDFFKQENCEILEGIQLSASEVKFEKDTIISVFQKELKAQKFTVIADIMVQTSCNGFEATFDTAQAFYELIIGKDESHQIHTLFLDSIYNYWTQKDDYHLDNYKYLSIHSHIFYSEGNYVMYSWPGHNRNDSFYLFGFKDRIMRVSLLGLKYTYGWGGLSSFMDEVVQFKFEGKIINPEYKSDFPPRTFLELYENQFFER